MTIQTDRLCKHFKRRSTVHTCIFVLIAISNYCLASPLPTIQNAIAPSLSNAYIGSTAIYNCSFGYFGTPMSTCLAYNVSTGNWSTVNGSCICMSQCFNLIFLYNNIPCFLRVNSQLTGLNVQNATSQII